MMPRIREYIEVLSPERLFYWLAILIMMGVLAFGGLFALVIYGNQENSHLTSQNRLILNQDARILRTIEAQGLANGKVDAETKALIVADDVDIQRDDVDIRQNHVLLQQDLALQCRVLADLATLAHLSIAPQLQGLCPLR